MSTPDFSTAENNQELANEVSCLKAMLTLMLQAMGQADAGRVMLKMEKQLALIEDETQAAVFSKTVKQIKRFPLRHRSENNYESQRKCSHKSNCENRQI